MENIRSYFLSANLPPLTHRVPWALNTFVLPYGAPDLLETSVTMMMLERAGKGRPEGFRVCMREQGQREIQAPTGQISLCPIVTDGLSD